MKRSLLMFCILFSLLGVNAQPITQTIRGKVVDKESKYPLTGVTIKLLTDTSGTRGCASDVDGNFVLENVPVGRHSLQFSYMGYSTRVLDNITVSSAKQVVLNVDLEESITLAEEVIISNKKNSSDPQNEMAIISARSFTVEETDRFAGSRGDPSRMASNYAGVQGANDSRNDIVIRGNSPAGVLWRVEGIDIPNPNHFAIPGTTGGPVNIINNKMLANSDFYTGAFPAEFGNATAGVFDLKFRPGNNQKYENSFQFGFLGTELFSEGPINKKKGSSYLVGYRYSSLALFDALKFDIGTNAVPKYQDGGFKLNFPLKNNASISVWGIGGYSSIDILISELLPEERNIYGENDRDQYFTSYMGVLGATYNKSFNSNTFLKVTVAAMNQSVVVHHEYLFYSQNRDTLYKKDPLLQYTFSNTTYNTHASVNHKLSKKLTLKAGVLFDIQKFNYHDSARAVVQDNQGNYNLDPWSVRWNADEYALLLRPYAQVNWKPTARFTANFGLHSQYSSLNNAVSAIEPRASMRYAINSKTNMSAGLGLHSQMQSPYLYFYQFDTVNGTSNRDMGFTKSFHSVIGLERSLGKSTRVKSELYFQYLFDVPVKTIPSSFSLLNTGSGFSRFFPEQLVNQGKGRNYGLELSVEHFFSKRFFFLVTGSLFDAKYQGSDNVWRNTDFNGGYALSAILTKEWKVGKSGAFQAGTNVTHVGGRYYSPADTALSNARSELIEVDSLKNTLQTPAYFRMDLRLSYKWNRPKVSHEFALDIVNVLNTKNVLALTYAPDPSSTTNVRFEYQLSLLPLFYYRLDF
ncbi:MAG: TonB-dependent receptor [Bacteroidetes bacterium]|nr:MAG: TonB-dependent receptor [Bacteroidota bacterium]